MADFESALKQGAQVAGASLLGASGPSGRASATSLLNNRLRLAEAQRQSDLELQQLTEEKERKKLIRTVEMVKAGRENPEAWERVVAAGDGEKFLNIGRAALQGLGESPDMVELWGPEAKEVATRSVEHVDPVSGKTVVQNVPTSDLTARVAAPSRVEQGEPGSFASADDFARQDKVTQRRRVKEREGISNQLSKAQAAFDSFKKAPGAGGITGAVAENIGGLLGQLPIVGGTIEEGLNVALTGGTTEENARARTNAITLASDLLPEITGEESGRFTEAERDLAFKALKLLKPNSSNAQIAAAYRVFIEVSINSLDRSLKQNQEAQKFDTSTKEGALNYVNNLIDRGFNKEQAVGAMKRRIREERLTGG
jgi:hypothetical protein